MTAAAVLSKVLIVDDTRTNIAILVEALRDECKLGVATSGKRALEYARDHRPDLVLLDIMMPEMDGYEVCTRLKEDPATASIPVIFITALSEIADKSRGFELGAVDYITKPFEVVEVRARVRTHLKIERYRRELEEKNRALEGAQARLEHQVKELQGRDRLVRVQMSVSDLGEAEELILQTVEQVLGAGSGVLYRPDAKGQQLEVRSVKGREMSPAPVPLSAGASAVVRAYREREPQRIGEGGVAVPLLYRRTVLGVLLVEGLSSGRMGYEEVFDTLWRLSGEAALVLNAARLSEELERDDLQVLKLMDLDDESLN